MILFLEGHRGPKKLPGQPNRNQVVEGGVFRRDRKQMMVQRRIPGQVTSMMRMCYQWDRMKVASKNWEKSWK